MIYAGAKWCGHKVNGKSGLGGLIRDYAISMSKTGTLFDAQERAQHSALGGFVA